VLILGIVIGLALGSVVDLVLVCYGWKAAAVMTLAVIAGLDLLVWRTSLTLLDVTLLLLAFASARLLVEPAIKRRLRR
jgi:hypothetical protein